MLRPDNPFEVTKAVDFTDAQIESTWVDLPGGGFTALANPASPMPRFLVGGKGGGRTHLLRHFSFALQRLRHQADLAEGLAQDGYVGIYFRCTGLNSSRFAGKRQDLETWDAVFAYYVDVWFARLAIDVVRAARDAGVLDGDMTATEAFVADVLALFDLPVAIVGPEPTDPLARLTAVLDQLQKGLDVSINNVALTHNLDVTVAATPGRLVFGLPAAAARHFATFRNVAFAYLIDEFENLSERQQRYINTLIREKELPATFLIGSRQFGLRTHATLSANEENKQGSEFDLVVLEEAYRSRPQDYAEFCRNIVRQRLGQYGIYVKPDDALRAFFDSGESIAATLESRAEQIVDRARADGKESLLPYRLEKQLSGLAPHKRAKVLRALVQVENPLHRKFALFLFYRGWADGHDLEVAADWAVAQAEGLTTGDSDAKTRVTYKHYKADLYAQLLDEHRLEQEYVGFDTFIRMSGYLPRNLLVVLKQITRWALFLGEDPFSNPISVRAQQEGAREASSWFLTDAKGLGKIGDDAQIAVRRLGGLFRQMRFADKPVEVSCAAFTSDLQSLTADARRVLHEAKLHSLVLEIPSGRWGKNSGTLKRKYQLNPMLAPMFDLPIALRGAADFSADVLNAVFDPSVDDAAYGRMQRMYTSRLNAPFQSDKAQATLEL